MTSEATLSIIEVENIFREEEEDAGPPLFHCLPEKYSGLAVNPRLNDLDRMVTEHLETSDNSKAEAIINSWSDVEDEKRERDQ